MFSTPVPASHAKPNVRELPGPIRVKGTLRNNNRRDSAYELMMPNSPKKFGPTLASLSRCSRKECIKRARRFLKDGAGGVIDVDHPGSSGSGGTLERRNATECVRCDDIMWVPIVCVSYYDVSAALSVISVIQGRRHAHTYTAISAQSSA